MRYEKCTIERNGETLFECSIADSHLKKFLGLMKKDPRSFGPLLLEGCNQIHMFNMDHPLDVIYLDKYWEIIDIEEHLLPGKIGHLNKGCIYVLELPVGYVNKFLLKKGDILKSVEEK